MMPEIILNVMGSCDGHLWKLAESWHGQGRTTSCFVTFYERIARISWSNMTLLDPARLAQLDGKNKVVFTVNGTDTTGAEYLRVIYDLGKSCCDLSLKTMLPLPRVVQDIPETVFLPGLEGVVIFHVNGSYDCVDLDVKFLIDKVDIYLYSMNGDGVWHELHDSRRPIENANKLAFTGAYNNIDKGLFNPSLKLGFASFMRAVIAIQKGNITKVNVLNIVINLCEPVRITKLAHHIASTMIRVPNQPVEKYDMFVCARFEFWMKSYGQICEMVRKLKYENEEWIAPFTSEGEEVTPDMVVEYLSVILCKFNR